MAKNINFTKKTLLDLPSPNSGRDYYKDTKEKGLACYVTTKGIKTFFVRKRVMGRDERFVLGRFPDMSIEQARKQSLVVKAEIASGKDPNNAKKKLRNDLTFKEMFDRYIDDYARSHNKTWEDDVYEVTKNLKHWFPRKASSITNDEIRKLHVTFGKNRGIYGANRLLDRIKAIYNKAIEWGWEGKNPAIGIKKFPMKSRERFIQADEMPCLFRALDEEQNDAARDYIWLSLLTGARKSNVLSMRWDDINFQRREWFIPETKNGEAVTIPLVERACVILEERRKRTNSQWVFPSPKNKEKDNHLADPKKAWKRVLQQATLYLWEQDPKIEKLIKSATANLPEDVSIYRLFDSVKNEAEAQNIILPKALMDVRLHDIRRTFGSYQAITGASLPIIGKSLGHKSAQATQIYSRLNLDPIRVSLEKATEAMFSGGK